MRSPDATSYLSIKNIVSKRNPNEGLIRPGGIIAGIESYPEAMCEGQKVRGLRKCTHGPVGTFKTWPATVPFLYCSRRLPTVPQKGSRCQW